MHKNIGNYFIEDAHMCNKHKKMFELRTNRRKQTITTKRHHFMYTRWEEVAVSNTGEKWSNKSLAWSGGTRIVPT